MNETASGHGGGPEPPEQKPIPYVCTDCRRTFSVPAGASDHMDSLAVEGLTCPWCGRWAMPAQGDPPTLPVKWSPMRKGIAWVVAVMLACLVGALGYLAWAEKDDERAAGGEDDPATLAAAVGGATVSLERGLALAEGHGTPVSAKFEGEDQAFQLSIYVLAGSALSEMVVDPQTGRVVKVESITGGDDLRAAKRYANAMSKATVPLRAAVERALTASEGSRAVSVVPQRRRGHPMAEVTVANGQTFMTVSERLD
jgi:hypothetical protein